MGDRPDYAIVLLPLSRENGGGYLARVPDLPGCFSDGETDIQALERAHDAIASWIAHALSMGWPIPEPTKHREYA